MRYFLHGRTVTLLAVAAFAACAAPAGAAEPVARFEAVAVNTSNVGKRGLTGLQITIERWSTEQERNVLRDALVEKGTDALLKALQKIKPRAGSISATGRLGWNIQFAQEIELPSGGRRVIFATDRPMTFIEQWNKPRSVDYQFMLAELRIGANGKGEGKLVPQARITWDEGARTVEIENYANEPVRLSQVEQR